MKTLYKSLVSYKQISDTHSECTFYNLLEGNTFTKTLPVTDKQIRLWKDYNILIQNAMTELTDDERELFLTGYTNDEFEALFTDD